MTIRELIERLQMATNQDLPIKLDVDTGCTECSGEAGLRAVIVYRDQRRAAREVMSEGMTVERAQELRCKLEHDITALIRLFEAATGTTVDSIELMSVTRIGEMPGVVRVTVGVTL